MFSRVWGLVRLKTREWKLGRRLVIGEKEFWAWHEEVNQWIETVRQYIEEEKEADREESYGQNKKRG